MLWALDDLTAPAVSAAILEPPPARTVAHAWIRAALAHAVREDLLPRNVARQIQIPADERPEIDLLTVEEAHKPAVNGQTATAAGGLNEEAAGR